MTYTASATEIDVAELRGSVAGPVLLPGDAGYAAEAVSNNLNNPLVPAVVVGVTNVADVQTVVRFAALHRLHVAVRATGHQTARDADGAVMINLARLDGIRIDAAARTARVEAGVRWAAVVDAAAEHGLAPLNGSAPTVSVIGYTLGGGQSPVLGRSRGYAADHVRKLEVVTADGTLREVTAASEPDLFWALRGGKGNFGVVTAIEFDLFPVTEFYGGGVFFPGDRMAEVLNAWRTWAPTLPESATTSIAVQRLPPVPDLPEPLRGAFVVHVRFANLGSAADGERLFAPIREAAPVLIDAVQTLPYRQNALIHLDPTEPIPYYDRTTTLREITPEVVDALVAFAGPGSGNPLLSIEIRALGGAFDREPAVPDAVPTRGIPYVVFGFGVGGPDQADVLRDWLARLVRTLEPWSASDRRMVNFLSKDEAVTPAEMRLAYGPDRYDRLVRIKRRFDPDNMFRNNHNIVSA
ncbi:FAD-binding oxidoreductase [Actinoplanes sp. TBRC 11911]|uniref:FAD-binding oxidoreductase n=1 Tax=Actinoplanes sp. TBRC 11911 TaxID=2729386 RepID=UPI00145EE1C1|nr:FAD-binding oxidoreductase [Actinoplanes sp. TBRC 11911]NMO55247.1 FAD-binding oxidoreductase [Actinoplanes sp. TBRC 11911]